VKIGFPSEEFDRAVAAVCHGQVIDEQASALNELLRGDAGARDEYLLRVELHARLASDPDLFPSVMSEVPSQFPGFAQREVPIQFPSRKNPKVLWALGLAACIAIVAVGFWMARQWRSKDESSTRSKAVALLNGTVDARWGSQSEPTRLNAPLEPGLLRLESGLAQVVFYSGARVVIEGPAELELISRNEARCRGGRIVADVPPQARGFRIETAQGSVTDLGTSFGLEVKESRTEVHVFKGRVELRNRGGEQKEGLPEGFAAVMESSGPVKRSAANQSSFASLFQLREKSVAAEALRYDQWRVANERIKSDPSLLVHFDFESLKPSGWQLQNLAKNGAEGPDAIVIGCQQGEGRWPEKRSLEFQSMNDRVRLNVPGEFDALTFSAWISVKGLDRKINSLFMSDGFLPGTVHWFIRNDGVPGFTIIGGKPGEYQIVIGPPGVTLDKFGMWLHLAVVLDGTAKQVVQYLNGVAVNQKPLKIAPPFRVEGAELGNWNPKGFPEDDPFMIRNFSGAMDEVYLFSRALDPEEIRKLYAEGKPQGNSLALH
jgi:hypothetical protein